MGKRSSSGGHLAIRSALDFVKKQVTQLREIEALLENPNVSAAQKRRLRLELEKLPWYPKEPPKRPKSSLQLLTQATYLKGQAKLYEASGRNNDARRIRAEATKLEIEGKRIRTEEAKTSN